MATKRFLCVWNSPYTFVGEKVVKETFFTKSMGYHSTDIILITTLDIGQVYAPKDPNLAHVILRLPDEESLTDYPKHI